LVDPELTYSLPPGITSSTGLDALTQLIEPYVCTSPTPLTDTLCLDGMALVFRSLLRAYHNGQDASARADMSLASLFGGMSLANARLGAVHGLAAALGGFYSAPHGMLCARFLPLVMETNVKALLTRQADSPALDRYRVVAQIVCQNHSATIQDGIAIIHKLCLDLGIPGLINYGLSSADFPDLIRSAQASGSMKGNPIRLTDKELGEILERSI